MKQDIRNRTLISAGLLALILFAQSAGFLAPLNRFLTDHRFAFGDKKVSGEIVFVAIDKRSLDTVGVWPWPRSLHGEITDRLREAGAREIVFDVDFSTASNPADDAAFAAAIERAGGIVTLPVFLQHSSADAAQSTVELSTPIEALARNAWLASVNVFPDTDGKVRRFPDGIGADGTFIASIPATIAGRPLAEAGRGVRIDFGLDAAGIPTASAADVLTGRADPLLFEGKTAIIGALATELRDFYSVPRHGVVAGSVLQILTAETLMAGRNLATIDGMTVAAATSALLLLVLLAAGFAPSVRIAPMLIVIAALSEALAVELYVQNGIMAPTAFIHVAIAVTLAFRWVMMTDFFRGLLKEATANARMNRKVLQQVVRENFDAIIVTDGAGRILQANSASQKIFDIADPDAAPGTPAVNVLPADIAAEIGLAIADIKSGRTPATALRTAQLSPADGTARAIEYMIGVSILANQRETSETDRPNDDTEIVVCLTARDISERLSYEEKLRWMSDNDDMTGLARRHAFVRRTEETLAEHGKCAVATFNLHRFKTVNLALGRETGNALLQEVARRIRPGSGGISASARLGGDTFAVLLDGICDEAAARAACEDISAALMQPYRIDQGRAHVGVQAGLTVHDTRRDGPASGETLLDHAEMALDESRIATGSRIVLYDEALADQRRRSRIIERDLWNALERNEIHLNYQAKLSLADGKPTGAEALMRWTHPELGNVSPADFIAIAEANGSIETLGRWALETACREAATWREDLGVSVNIAPQQFRSDRIVADVDAALRASGLRPDRLTLELVESEMLETDNAVFERIDALKRLGARLSLDDFGTGYSGVGYLSRLRFDEIKIDRQFTANLSTDREAQGIVRSVAVLAETFEMKIVAEGIETQEQELFLRLAGCHEGQGYLYSKPVPAAEFRALIADMREDFPDRAAARA